MKALDGDISKTCGDTCLRSWGHQMPTNKKRVKISLLEETTTQLQWLIEEKEKETKKRVYPGQVIDQLIQNEYKIKQAFRK